MPLRARMIVSGKVQKSGYREFVHERAFDLDLNGFVRNLPDGTVEVVCEGERVMLDELAKRIDIREFPVKVDAVSVDYSEATGEFDDFTVVRDERFDDDIAGKLDLGLVFIKRMHRDLSEKQDTTIRKQDGLLAKQDIFIEKQDTLIAKQDMTIAKQEETVEAVRAMNASMDGHFRTLDGKYDGIGENVAEMSRDLKDIKAIASEASTDKSDN